MPMNEIATQLAKLREAGLGYILHCVGARYYEPPTLDQHTPTPHHTSFALAMVGHPAGSKILQSADTRLCALQ